MLTGKLVLKFRDPTGTKNEKGHTLKSQKPGKYRTQSYKHTRMHTAHTSITILGLVKQLFSKQCLEKKLKNMTSPIPLSNTSMM